MGLALLARTPAESPKAANALRARGEEPRRTEFDPQGQNAVVRGARPGRLGIRAAAEPAYPELPNSRDDAGSCGLATTSRGNAGAS